MAFQTTTYVVTRYTKNDNTKIDIHSIKFDGVTATIYTQTKPIFSTCSTTFTTHVINTTKIENINVFKHLFIGLNVLQLENHVSILKSTVKFFKQLIDNHIYDSIEQFESKEEIHYDNEDGGGNLFVMQLTFHQFGVQKMIQCNVADFSNILLKNMD